MPVAVVSIGVVRMPMPEADMHMPVRMWLTGWIIRPMAVPMMIVMNVAVLVAERRMFVLVLMPLGQMEPHADAHEHPGGDELQVDRLAKPNHGNDRSDEGRRGIIRPRAGGSEMAQCDNEQHQAQSVAEQPHDGGRDDRRGRRQARAEQQCQYEVHRSRDEPFQHGDLHRIAERYLPGEIVVDRPGKTGAYDGERPYGVAERQ